MLGGWVGGWVKKCFLSLRQTALLSAKGKNILGKSAPPILAHPNL
jgi:hypothetical protein